MCLRKIIVVLVFLLFLTTNLPALTNTEEVKMTKSNYDLFEERTEGDVEKVKKQYKIPKLNQGFLISLKTVKPHISAVVYKKDDYTLDLLIAEQAIGFSANKILLSIIDIKAGLFTAYSFDKDYRYHGFFSGICFSIIKF